jgi:hypothetical protein
LILPHSGRWCPQAPARRNHKISSTFGAKHADHPALTPAGPNGGSNAARDWKVLPMSAFPLPRLLFPLFVRRHAHTTAPAVEAEPVSHAAELDEAWQPVPATTREIPLPSLLPEQAGSAGPRRSRSSA